MLKLILMLICIVFATNALGNPTKTLYFTYKTSGVYEKLDVESYAGIKNLKQVGSIKNLMGENDR